eukprot:CFRG2633T1
MAISYYVFLRYRRKAEAIQGPHLLPQPSRRREKSVSNKRGLLFVRRSSEEQLLIGETSVKTTDQHSDEQLNDEFETSQSIKNKCV